MPGERLVCYFSSLERLYAMKREGTLKSSDVSHYVTAAVVGSKYTYMPWALEITVSSMSFRKSESTLT